MAEPDTTEWVYVAIWADHDRVEATTFPRSALAEYRKTPDTFKSPHFFIYWDSGGLLQFFIERPLWEALGQTVMDES